MMEYDLTGGKSGMGYHSPHAKTCELDQYLTTQEKDFMNSLLSLGLILD
ncbi:MAG: hypothetical protein OXC44_05395 [Proteobacteria bacterium]|nr:hypothetical protein [Pseudomonadota bacterium]